MLASRLLCHLNTNTMLMSGCFVIYNDAVATMLHVRNIIGAYRNSSSNNDGGLSCKLPSFESLRRHTWRDHLASC